MSSTSSSRRVLLSLLVTFVLGGAIGFSTGFGAGSSTAREQTAQEYEAKLTNARLERNTVEQTLKATEAQLEARAENLEEAQAQLRKERKRFSDSLARAHDLGFPTVEIMDELEKAERAALLSDPVAASLVETAESEPAERQARARPANAPAPEPGTAAAIQQEILDNIRENPPVNGARFLFVGVGGTDLSEDNAAFLQDLQPGGVILQGGNIVSAQQTRRLVDAIKAAAGNGDGPGDLPLIAVDQEGGPVNRLRLEDAPSARAIGDAGDAAAAQAYGARWGTAARERAIGVVFAPVLDIYDEEGPDGWYNRTFGNDREHVTAMGLAMARGFLEAGVIPVVKHYPGHGSASADTHAGPSLITSGVRELARMVYPFAEAAAQGIPGIMTAHVAVPEIDGVTPATFSSKLIDQVLRQRWNFRGAVVADDIAMKAAEAVYGDPGEAAVQALLAGCDAIIYTDARPEKIAAVDAAIEQAVADLRLPLNRMQLAQSRLDAWAQWLEAPDSEVPAFPSDMRRRVMLAQAEEAGILPEPAGDAGAGEEETAEPEAALPDEEEPEAVLQPIELDAEEPPASAQDEEQEPSIPEGSVAIEHVVQPGEWLSRVAVKYGVRVNDIVEWNDLESNDVKFGTRLTIYLPEEEAPAGTAEPNEAPATDGAAAEDSPSAPEGRKRVVHEVKPGEMLSRLAQQYGVRTNDLIEWNDLEDPNIRIGQELIIYVDEE